MTKKLVLYFFSITTTLLLGCSAMNSQSGLVLKGEIPDAPNMQATLEKLGANMAGTLIAKSEIDPKGNFKLTSPEKLKAGMYKLSVGTKIAPIIVDGNENNITFKGSLASFDDMSFTVEGSKGTNEFTSAVKLMRTQQMNPDAAKKAINEATNPFTAMQIAMIMLRSPKDVDTHKGIMEKIKQLDPTSEYIAGYEQVIAQISNPQLQQQQQQQQPEEVIKLGQVAPEIAMANPQGKIMKLSDLKGKVVLLDFWASWCGPCRKANPHVVEIYKKYKDKGFTVFSVSLDGVDSQTKSRIPSDQVESQISASKDRWMQAIAKDNLLWDSHVSDLQKWENTAAREYGVHSIPKTYLVGRDGKIVAVNPRFNLEEELLKVL